jgi:hypothetical protein
VELLDELRMFTKLKLGMDGGLGSDMLKLLSLLTSIVYSRRSALVIVYLFTEAFTLIPPNSQGTKSRIIKHQM